MSERFQVWNVFLADGGSPCTCKKQEVLDMIKAEMDGDNDLGELRVVPMGTMSEAEFEALPEWGGP